MTVVTRQDVTAEILSHKAVQAALHNLNKLTQVYLNQAEHRKIIKAVEKSAWAHRAQTRKSGEPYVSHPIIVTSILAESKVDVDTLCAGLLHDTIEDTELTHADLVSEFGKTVADLVEGVTKLDKLKFRNLKEAQAETFVKMLFAMADDIRVVMIKLCDRLHNMRTIEHMSPSGQRRIAKETLEVYAPIAERIGLKSIQTEMETLSFKVLHPHLFEELDEKIREVSGNRKKTVDKIIKKMSKALLQSNLVAEINGRQKSIYSLYQKIKNKKLSFDQIDDLFGVRIVVKELQQCYIALGVIHNLYPPNENGFKDYIAVPKLNGYQSLHTVVKGPYGLILEVQIRTEEMDKMCELGVAAHWLYKRKNAHSSSSLLNARNWLNSLLRLQKDSVSSLEFYENLKRDLGTDEIYVFTPKGDIVQLPTNSSALDFAYSIHTSIGNQATAAVVNGQKVPLKYKLQTGQTVVIKTADEVTVNTDWLSIVASSKARTAIRKTLKQIKDEDALLLGHRMLDRALDTFGYSFEKLDQRAINRVLKLYQLDSMNDLLKSLAYGELLPSIAARKLLPLLKQRGIDKNYVPREALSISGTEGSIVNYPNCCQPIPGDEIIGYLSPAKGVVVHRKECRNVEELKKGAPERMVLCRWDRETSGEFKSTIKLDVINTSGVLAKLASVIADQNINIDTIGQADKDGGYTELVFTVNTESRQEIEELMARLLNYQEVLTAERRIS